VNEVGLADYLRVLAVVGDDDVTCRRVAAILGLAPSTPPPLVVSSVGVSTGAATASAVGTPTVIHDSRPDGPEPARHAPGGAGDDIELVELDEPLVAPAWPERVHAFTAVGRELPHDPLLDPRRTRALLTAALASLLPAGEIDVAALVDLAARARPVLGVPRRLRPSLGRGVQIIVDLADGMLPFRRDQTELLHSVDRLVADGLVAIVTSEGDPLETWSTQRAAMVQYTPPAPGTPVIALTDLGIRAARSGDRSVCERWLGLASRLRRAGAPLIALVPYPADQWPRELVAAITMITWDHEARVTEAQGAARRARSRVR
jgi:hypothetical protein